MSFLQRSRALLGALSLALVVGLLPLAAHAADGGDPPELDDVEELDIEELDVEEIAVEAAPSALDAASWRPENYPVLDRVVNVPTALTSRALSFRFLVDHRTFQPWTDQPFEDMLGFDAGGLKIGLGLRFGILDWLELGVYRLNNGVLPFDVYEFDLKFQALRQEEHFVNLAVRGGATWFYQAGAEDAAGGFGQLFVDRLFFHRLRVGTGLMFHSDSTDDAKNAADTDWSLAVPVYVDVRILDWLSWNVELVASVAGYGGKWPNFSSSVRFITHRHTFALVLSNNQYMSADGLVANSERGFDDLIIGFSITREF